MSKNVVADRDLVSTRHLGSCSMNVDCCVLDFGCYAFFETTSLSRSDLIMQRMEENERMDDERRQRIESLVRDVEGVTNGLDESTSRFIKDLIGELRELVENLLKADPVLEFFETRIWSMELAAETKDALDIVFREHRKDIVALKKVHEGEKEVLRRLYGRTERRRRLDDYFYRQRINQLKLILKKNNIEYHIEPMPDCKEMSDD